MITREGENLVFLLSLPRSGSTLLSAILGGHGDILAPPEPWLMLGLKNLRKPHMFDPAGGHLISIGLSELLFDELHLKSCRSYALTVYNHLLSERGKRILVDKTPRYFQIIPFLDSIFPQAKKIWMIRNPIDLAASYLRIWSVNLADAMAQGSYNRSLKDMFAVYDFVLGHKLLSDRFPADAPGHFLIRYEDLVENPGEEIDKICDFLRVERDERMADFSSNTVLLEEYGQAFMGDRKFPDTKEIHSRSVGEGITSFSKEQLQAMLDVIDPVLFEKFRYGDTLEACLQLGVTLPKIEEVNERRQRFERLFETHRERIESAFYLIEGLPLGLPLPQDSEIERLREILAEKDQMLGELAPACERLEEQNRLKDAEILKKQEYLDRVSLAVDVEFPFLENPLDKGRHNWPYISSGPILPETMPGGEPWPKITIVTPTLNQGWYIEEAILSVLRQNYPNLEYIIIDGGSEDETLSVIKRYEHLLTCFVSEKDRGQAHAINKGFAKATGEILGWLNSDDQLEPGALAAVAIAFRESSADIVAGVCSLYEDSELVGGHLTSCAEGTLPLQDLLNLEGCWLRGKFFYQPEVFFTRAIFDRAGGKVEEDLYYSMDYELWLRLAKEKARIKVIGKSLARYRRHKEQKTHGEKYVPELTKVRDDFAARKAAATASPPGKKAGMRLLLLNDVGYHYGAGIAHRRLAEALRWGGHEVMTLALNPHAQANLSEVSKKRVRRFERRIEACRPDAVVLGNIHGAGHVLHKLRGVVGAYPTIIYLHDLYLLTGRCAYPGDCDKYLTGCDDECPTAKEYPAMAPRLIGAAWEEKRSLFGSNERIMFLADSRWVAEKAREAVPSSSAIEVCHYGVDMEIFRPLDRSTCRSLLGLPQEKFIILTGAPSLGDKRKGVRYLTEALNMFRPHDMLVACMGNMDPQTPGPGFHHFGYVTDEKKMATIYSAADIFIGPSLEEAFGQVFLEATACGCPTVGFAIGGVPEIVRPNVSGVLAESVTPMALALAIRSLYEDKRLRNRLSVSGRLMVESEFSLQKWCHRFNSLMEKSGMFETLGLIPNLAFGPDKPEAPDVESGRISRSRPRRRSRLFGSGSR